MTTVTLATHCQIERAFFVAGYIYARIDGKNYRALRHVKGLQIEAQDSGMVSGEIINCFKVLDCKLCQQ